MTFRRSTCLAFLLGIALGVGRAAGEAPSPEGIAFFEKEVRPVLAERCYGCHSAKAKKLKANLLLDSKAGWEKGGDSGPPIVPGKPDQSILIKAVRYMNLDLQMPPKHKLPAHEIDALEKWVAMGAPDPRAGESVAKQQEEGIDIEKGREFWAFGPMRNVEPPQAAPSEWQGSMIDRHVFAKLEENGIEPVSRASKVALIRRASYDLTGLPPEPEAIDAFLADNSDDAFAKLIDRLLESSHFGERWGRHWLDVVRFAESTGGGRTMLLPETWRYRDYVIESYNRDKPLTEFIEEQLAGDLLEAEDATERRENTIATGFLAMGPTNYELQDKELLRMEIVDEQIDTTGRAFMAMTIGCARCHDHMFDPIPARDYYAMAGIFRSTKTVEHANVSKWLTEEIPPMTDEEKAATEKLKIYREREEGLKKQIAESEAMLKKLGAETERAIHQLGIIIDDVYAEKVGEWMSSTSVQRWIDVGYIHDKGEGKGEKSVTFRPKLEKAGEYEVRVSYSAGTNRPKKAPFTVHHAKGETTVKVDQTKKPPLENLFTSLGTFTFDAGDAGFVRVTNGGTKGSLIADAAQFIPQIGETPEEHPRKKMISVARRQLSARKKSLKELQKTRPKVNAPKAMMVKDESKTEDYHILIRGNAHKLGDKVPRGFLQVASDGAGAPKISEKASGRLELARWLASEKNPLTARVAANRIWLHLFGEGIVRTPDNFGATGEKPSHPELLDYLALRFVEHGWSTKKLIREIMLSRVYQAGSYENGSANGAKLDPENRLFWRAHRRRLDSEALRDTILAVSGKLDRKMGGPAIKKGTKSEFGYKFDSMRRSIYLPVFRNALPEIFSVFDFPDPNLVAGKRTSSTLPTQALYLMNHPFVIEQSQHAAARIFAGAEAPVTDRILQAYREFLGRPPTESEMALARDFLGESPDAAAQAAFMQSLFACLDFRYLD